ncbi:MAG: GNAT family N-acetyltransferase, partial [Rhizobiales bacterium]|nr:GNAT family N-acetyltransferase [Hyphomicrobiales bacterium]
MLGEQPHYDHPQLTAEEIERDVQRAPDPRFSGENVIFAARVDGSLAGFCWCVLFNPGTGLEAEVAEVYVDDDFRGR